MISEAFPPEICYTTETQQVNFKGSSIVPKPDVKLKLNEEEWPVDATGTCTEENNVNLCQELSVTINAGDLQPGFVNMEIDNGNTECLGNNSEVNLEVIMFLAFELSAVNMFALDS